MSNPASLARNATAPSAMSQEDLSAMADHSTDIYSVDGTEWYALVQDERAIVCSDSNGTLSVWGPFPTLAAAADAFASIVPDDYGTGATGDDAEVIGYCPVHDLMTDLFGGHCYFAPTDKDGQYLLCRGYNGRS